MSSILCWLFGHQHDAAYDNGHGRLVVPAGVMTAEILIRIASNRHIYGFPTLSACTRCGAAPESAINAAAEKAREG